MNKRYWGVYINDSKSLVTSKAGIPVILSSRTKAREFLSTAQRGVTGKMKVVRIALNLEHRLHDSVWRPIEQ
jgi:hypothetical protein